MRKYNRIAAVLLLILPFVFPSDAIAKHITLARGFTYRTLAEKFLRTELYFGLSRKDGGVVSDAEWESFLAEEVTPKFSDGFTVVDALGQFRDAKGAIIRERSKVLILLYPRSSRKASNTKIEVIRAAYIKRFEQESVLRMDLRKSVEVLF